MRSRLGRGCRTARMWSGGNDSQFAVLESLGCRPNAAYGALASADGEGRTMPPCAPAGRTDGGTASQLIRSVGWTRVPRYGGQPGEAAVVGGSGATMRVSVNGAELRSSTVGTGSLWRTVEAGDIRVRMVEYSPRYQANHRCRRDHVSPRARGRAPHRVGGWSSRQADGGHELSGG